MRSTSGRFESGKERAAAARLSARAAVEELASQRLRARGARGARSLHRSALAEVYRCLRAELGSPPHSPAPRSAPGREALAARLAPCLEALATGAIDFGALHEDQLALEARIDRSAPALRLTPARASARRALGAFYTPRELVELALDEALEPLLDDAVRGASRREAERALLALRVLDPACGSGRFLAGAARRIARRLAAVRGEGGGETALRSVVRQCLFGADVDGLALDLARAELAGAAGERDVPELSLHLARRDALLARLPGPERFDAVLGNPPFVDSQRLARERPAWRARVRRRFATARGNWDLFVPFVELAARATRPGGVFALVTPAKILGADYCAKLHELLLGLEVISMREIETAGLFGGAGQAAALTTVRNRPASPSHRVLLARHGAGLREEKRASATIAELRALPGGYLAFPLRASRPRLAPYEPLSALAELSDGLTTAQAYELAGLLRECPPGEESSPRWIKVVNTGTIDPLRLLWGERELVFLGRRFLRPVVDGEALRALSPLRFAQSQREKIVVAGLARRLEAAVAPAGWLCGKSAVQVLPREGVKAADVARYLNSNPAQELYRALFGARGFGRGSLHVGPRQLERLPMQGSRPKARELGAAVVRNRR